MSQSMTPIGRNDRSKSSENKTKSSVELVLLFRSKEVMMITWLVNVWVIITQFEVSLKTWKGWRACCGNSVHYLGELSLMSLKSSGISVLDWPLFSIWAPGPQWFITSKPNTQKTFILNWLSESIRVYYQQGSGADNERLWCVGIQWMSLIAGMHLEKEFWKILDG